MTERKAMRRIVLWFKCQWYGHDLVCGPWNDRLIVFECKRCRRLIAKRLESNDSDQATLGN